MSGGETAAMDRALVKLTRPPWFALYLVPAGFAIGVLAAAPSGSDRPAWAFPAVLLGVLLAVRCAAILLRRVVPVSPAVTAGWFRTRLEAKRHDSYQWQKLLWVAVGLLVEAAAFARPEGGHILAAVTCLAIGALGAAWWRLHHVPSTSPRAFHPKSMGAD